MTVLPDLHALYLEHRRCGELESLEGDYVAEAMSITRRPHEGENLMAIAFKLDSTTGEGTFIRVLRDGQPFGKILDAMGLYRFYEGDREKLGGAALQDADLARLKTAIQSRYDSPRR